MFNLIMGTFLLVMVILIMGWVIWCQMENTDADL